MIPKLGHIYAFKFDQYNANLVNKRCKSPNPISGGDVFPMIVTRIWNETAGTINGQVFLDGNDIFWATSVVPGEGTYQYKELE